jgi:cytochrome c
MRHVPLVAVLAWVPLLASCRFEGQRGAAGTRAAEAAPPRFGVGRPADAHEIRALDDDVDGVGRGLPPGRGDVATGAVLFARACASCHGAKGEGTAGVPPLVGAEPRDSFPFGRDMQLPRTIGNYWPHAPPLFDYIRRSMPLTAPGSLTDNEVYSLTAFLLAANEVIPAEATLDSASLAAVRMPARDRFVPDNRRGGRVVR